MIKTIIGVLTIVSLCFGAFFFFESRYASSMLVSQIEQRLDYKILSDKLYETKRRIYQIEDRYQGRRIPLTVLEELRELRYEKEKLEKQIERLN